MYLTNIENSHARIDYNSKLHINNLRAKWDIPTPPLLARRPKTLVGSKSKSLG
jgi:hypothetical protein